MKVIYFSCLTKRLFVLAGMILLLSGLYAASPPPLAQAQAQADAAVAFINVNVIPMDTEQVLEGQTVIIEGDRIAAVGAVDAVAVPEGAEIVDGDGAYLMPGLADMHMHLDFDPDPDSLQLFLAQGVTTVRNLNAIPEHLAWREQVANGDLLGPTIYTSGNGLYGVPSFLNSTVLTFRAMVILTPLVIGLLIWLVIWLLSKFTGLVPDFRRFRRYLLPSLAGLLLVGILLAWFRVIPLTAYIQRSFPHASVPESEAEARQMVRDQAAAGVDFIKPYDWMSREIYFALMDEAEKMGVYTDGHIVDAPYFVTLAEMVAAGQDEVAHADEFMSYVAVDFDPAVNEWVEYEMDMSRIGPIAALMAENDVALSPTLITNEAVLLGLENLEMLRAPEYGVIRPERMAEWQTTGRLANFRGQDAFRREAWRLVLLQLTKAMQDQGALLTLGTDVGVEGIIPGYSAHQELALLVEAGLSNFEALAAGTRNAAQITGRMGADGAWGTVTEGNRADLILLPQNPLEDVAHTQERVGVMVQGQWFTQTELDELVNEFVATY